MTMDVCDLYKESGYFTYDLGFMVTASCRSDITYLDGEKETLKHRGYPIEQLSTFIDRAKGKNNRFRQMVLGHRVYKNHDPRAK